MTRWHWAIYRAGLFYRACDLTDATPRMATDLDAVTCPDCVAVIRAGTVRPHATGVVT